MEPHQPPSSAVHHYHHSAPYPPGPENGLGTAAFVVGLCACVFSFVPIIGLIAWPMLVIGIGLSIAALHKVKTGAATNKALVLVGLVLSLVALVVCIGWVAMMVVPWATAPTTTAM